MLAAGGTFSGDPLCNAADYVDALRDDANRSAVVDTVDSSQTRQHFGESANESNFLWDWNADGTINTIDNSSRKLLLGHTAPQCP